MKKISILILMVGWVIALAAQTAQSVPDPWVGKWRMDASQSQFHSPAPQGQTLQVQSATSGAIQYTVSGTDADGKPVLQSFDGKADGQAYPISVNGLEGGRMSYQQVSDHEFTGQGTTSNGIPVTSTVTLSPDGQTITIKRQVADSKGPFSETVVYARQPR
jgi:hypothetical protein